MLKRELLASVGLVSLMASASAADVDLKARPLPAPVWSWSGLYIGGHAGYGWGQDPFNDVIFTGKILTGIKAEGALWGFQAGANWQMDAWVGGLEIDLSSTSIKGSTSLNAITTIGDQVVTSTGTQTDTFDLLGSARARLGYLVWPGLLAYGTGGLAWTRFVEESNFTFSVTGPTSGTIAFSSSTPTWRFGFAVGAGVEARLWDSNWLARLEYLHYDFGDSGGSSFSDGSISTSGRLTVDLVRGGLSYKFGEGGAAFARAASLPMPVKAPPRALAWSWSGYYVGGHAGYGWGHDPFTQPFFDTFLTNTDSSGFVGGFQAGANWQRGPWVGGLEVDLSATDIKGSTSLTVAIPGGTETSTRTDKFDLLGSARARLGYLAWPNALLYGTGGLAWTRFVQTSDDVQVTVPDGTLASSFSNPSWRFGWVAGVGAETRVWNSNWLARLEYLHYDFGDSGSSFSSGSPGSTSGHLTADVVRGGLSYKFGGGATDPANVAMAAQARAGYAAWDWSGFYIGGHAGYGWGRDPMSDAVFGDKMTDGILRTGIDAEGFVAGFHAGANWQFKAWVAGLEIDLSGTGIKGSTTNVASDGSESLTTTDTFDLLGSARARLGYAVWPNVLLYGTGGLAWTRLVQDSVSVFETGTNGGSGPIWKFGWTAGAGGEVRLWDSNWLVRVEYLHYDFGDGGRSSESISVSGLTASAISTTGHLTADVVRGGLSYKFD